MPDQNDAFFASYAKGIADMLGFQLNRGAKQRLHVAPLSLSVFVSITVSSEGYQNYQVYQLGNSVPHDDHPLLTFDGGYLDSYDLYLDMVDLKALTPSGSFAAADAAQADYKTARGKWTAALTEAQTAFPVECKTNGAGGYLDPITGETITFQQYVANYRPELATLKIEYTNANTQWQNVLTALASSSRVTDYNKCVAELALANETDKFNVGFNMAAEVSDPQALSLMSKITTPAPPPAAPFFRPDVKIGGSLQEDIKGWIDTFPKDYERDPTFFNQHASLRITVTNSDLKSTTWEDHGFSTSTSTTGSSGWFFWSSVDTTTNTTITENVDVRTDSIQQGIDIKIWGGGVYPVIYGTWRHDVTTLFPQLQTAPAVDNVALAKNVQSRFVDVLVGYGVQISFQVDEETFNKVVRAKNSAESHNGSLSIFGSIYRGSNSSSTTNSSSFSDLDLNVQNHTVTIRAKDNKCPIVLGAVVEEK